MASAPSGWYPDPDDAERLRWWDGATWQEQRRPRPNPRRSAWVWAASTGGGFLIACFVVGFGRAMVLLGLFAVVAALVALSGKTFAWLRAGIWKAFTLGAGAILLLGGGAATAATDAGARTAARLTGAPIATAEARASSTPTPSPAPNVTVEELTVTEPVPFARTQQDDPGRDIGTSAVIVAGADGVRTIVYAVTYRDGVEAGRRVVSNTITTSPVDEVTAVGRASPHRHPLPRLHRSPEADATRATPTCACRSRVTWTARAAAGTVPRTSAVLCGWSARTSTTSIATETGSPAIGEIAPTSCEATGRCRVTGILAAGPRCRLRTKHVLRGRWNSAPAVIVREPRSARNGADPVELRNRRSESG